MFCAMSFQDGIQHSISDGESSETENRKENGE